MKTEIEVEKTIVIFGFLIGAAILGAVLNPCQECQQQQIDCLTPADLNAEHLNAVISLSRFCEGLGLQSTVYWQQDDLNRSFAVPVCIEVQQ